MIYHSYGFRGMGDLVSSTSWFITKKLKEKSHIVFHLPDGFGYDKLMDSIMSMWTDLPYQLTHEVTLTNAFIDKTKAKEHFFQLPNFNECELIHRFIHPHLYWPAKKQWVQNVNGPIAIAPNHEFFNSDHPVKEKFFNQKNNDYLHSLIDSKNYFLIGSNNTFEENVNIISNSRYVIGIEGGWTHITNSMRTPFIICNNERSARRSRSYHLHHPCLRTRDTKDMHPYLKIT